MGIFKDTPPRTPSVKMADYETPSEHGNSWDWDAYNAAQVANGEKCACCSTHMFIHHGVPQQCSGCTGMKDDTEELTHDTFVRCPKCGDHWSPRESEDYEVFGDGEHEVSCGNCDHDFEVSTSVSYSFTSPERDGHVEEEEKVLEVDDNMDAPLGIEEEQDAVPD